MRSQKKAAVGAAIALIVYTFLAGAAIPVQRSAWMGAAAYVGLLAEREVQPLRLWAWACLIQLTQNPHALESISFQLSFLSVFILLLLRYLPPVHWAVEPFRATALVMAGTLPAAAWHFHMVSWSALIANLWAIPFFNFALITGAAALALADVPAAGWFTAKICALCLDTGLGGLRVLAQWRYGWTTVAQPPIWKIVHYYFWAAGWFLLSRVRANKVDPPLRFLFFAGWIAAGSLFWISIGNPAWSVTVLSGTRLPTAHIQSGSTHWLVNVGQGSGSHDTQRRLLPYLKWRGIHRVEGLILTDYPKDMDFSLGRLQEEIRFKRIYGPAPKGPQAPAFFLSRDKIPWQRVSFLPLMTSRELSIQALSHSGKVTLIRITVDGTSLFLVMQLDAETVTAIEKFRDQRTVLVLYGSAAGHTPWAMRRRERIQKRMLHAIWVEASDSQRGQLGTVSAASAGGKSYSLKQLGALQIGGRLNTLAGRVMKNERAGDFFLQFLSGTQVTFV